MRTRHHYARRSENGVIHLVSKAREPLPKGAVVSDCGVRGCQVLSCLKEDLTGIRYVDICKRCAMLRDKS